ncbi:MULTISPECIES: DUF6541 family protein [unclassified Arthrobacter]|uniref:DUF6541 family protein n=1 Tax=unclassified Arthrobacter TaxID=235627 RepID=UPI001E52979E|nr:MULTISPECIES: DUF6541 family protein [unclassified Arthrobacter]MCC9146461.1 hypothetical protein [Arthrobacter sp. zg-Y919]MDK1277691.1 hypothetical protein [Arthrobacter sp. zg.Y919]WIB02351.1 hypothetical protein QNO10_10305 [Arthrobacter sp. zg-Y919]
MDWLEAIPVILAAAAILFIPGLAVTLALRLRVFDAVALAPLVTITFISVGAMVASLAGISWSIAVPLAGAALVAVLALLVGRRAGVDSPAQRFGRIRGDLLFFTGAAVAFLIIALQVVRVVGSPEAFSQSFDNIFHLNAVHHITETGDASSLTVESMTAGDGPVSFYPAAWHGFMSLIVQLTGAPLTVCISAGNIVLAAMVWPLSALFAVRQLAKLVPAAKVGAGVLVAAFPAFPILLLDFGVIYPNFMALALVPAGLAIAAVVFGQAPEAKFSVKTGVALGALTYPGIAIAHPNGMMTLLLLAVPLVIGAYCFLIGSLRSRGAGARSFILPTVVLAAVLALFAVLWNVIRPPEVAAIWERVETSAQAFGEALLNAPFGRPVALVVSVLAIVGVAACLKNKRLWWLPASYLVSIGVFVIVAGFESTDFRDFVTGVWYNDAYRLAAVLPLVAAPLSILGLNAVLTGLWRRAASRGSLARAVAGLTPRRRTVLTAAAAVAAVAVLLPLTQGRNMDDAVARASSMYALTDDSALVSTDELELMEQLDELVPEDATVAVNPYTGGALAYAFGDRDTTHKHTLDTVSEDIITVEKYLRDADERPEVCAAAAEENVEYVLDLGRKEVHGGDHRYPGIEKLRGSDDFELVKAVGNARLYEFIGC